MSKIIVKLKERSYPITIGNRILSRLGAALRPLRIGSDSIVITSAPILKLYGKTLSSGLRKSGFSVKILTVPDGEQSKSTPVAVALLNRLAKAAVGKKIFIIALGGGVIGDLAGFAASVYKRGIPYIQVPTTLLAQIDSAIGGKVAIDLPAGKNLVGSFYQPKLVYSDVALLKTLPARQIRNGLAEAVKYGIIRDPALFNYIERNSANILKADSPALDYLVQRCSRIKAGVVMKDEKETKGVRTILNFGHTLGHAIEAAGGYARYQHGESIAIGIRMACHISYQLGLVKAPLVKRVNSLLTRLGLPQGFSRIPQHRILAALRHDKKFIAGKNRFVLVQKIGRVRVQEGIPLEKIIRAIQAYRK